jgi:YfiH family protein
VEENRARAAACFGLPAQALSTCYQIHSADALIATAPFGAARPEGDAVVTDRPGVICGALAADCAPVLIVDPAARIVAAAHAGWKGALAGIVEAAVVRMVELGARRERLVAAIGPCIGPASYEVGLDFLERFSGEVAGAERFFQPGLAADKRMFDLPAFVLHRLAEAGVAGAEWIGRDTCAEEEVFFSNRRAYRRGEADYGRLLSAIALE